MAKLNICLVVHNAYGAMAGGRSGHIGGVERQTTMLARWLAARGHKVSLLTWDEGQRDGEVIDGVQIFKMSKSEAGIPGFRFIVPRMTSLFSAMKRANAEIYYHNCAEHYTGLAALWCRMNGRKFVYSTAHDNGCEVELPMLKKGYERFFYRYGMRNCDKLIVQTEKQRRMVRDGFGLDSIALPMPCPGPSAEEYVQPSPPENPVAVWVGRAAEIKRMEALLDIAEAAPDLKFEIAAAQPQTTYAQGLYARAQKLPNVKWLGAVAREQMPALYQRATCLACTSLNEGFPNTFLESWSWGKPIVTSFDPDDITARLRLGMKCNTTQEFLSAIRELAKNKTLWMELSRNSRRYYEENHLVDTAQGRFEKVFLEVCGKAASTETISATNTVPALSR